MTREAADTGYAALRNAAGAYRPHAHRSHASTILVIQWNPPPRELKRGIVRCGQNVAAQWLSVGSGFSRDTLRRPAAQSSGNGGTMVIAVRLKSWSLTWFPLSWRLESGFNHGLMKYQTR